MKDFIKTMLYSAVLLWPLGCIGVIAHYNGDWHRWQVWAAFAAFVSVVAGYWMPIGSWVRKSFFK